MTSSAISIRWHHFLVKKSKVKTRMWLWHEFKEKDKHLADLLVFFISFLTFVKGSNVLRELSDEITGELFTIFVCIYVNIWHNADQIQIYVLIN